MRLLSWLPGISAADRLGIKEADDGLTGRAQLRAETRSPGDPAADRDDEAVRLPQGDIFYWSMLHSHL